MNNEIKAFHLVTLVLQGKKPTRNHCAHRRVPHDYAICDINTKVCVEEDGTPCETRLDEEADIVKNDGLCPFCGHPLSFFSGLEHVPAYMYCQECNDIVWDENGQVLAKIE